MSGEQMKWEGNNAFKEEDFDTAIEKYTKAEEAYPKGHKDLPAVFSNRAMCHLKQDNYSLALSDADMCIAAKPEWFKGHHRKAEALMGLKDYEGAESSFAEALANKPGQFEQILLKRLEEASYAKEGLYFKQLLSGRDMATVPISMTDNFTFPIAQKAKAYSYIIGDVKTKECVLVDPAWDLATIKAFVEGEEMTITGVLLTSWHPHHCGGVPAGEEGTGTFVQGVTELVDDNELLPVYVNPGDVDKLKEKNFITDGNIIKTEDGHEIKLGSLTLRVMHTPGPTPGHQCIVINDSYCMVGDLVFPNQYGLCEDDTDLKLRTMYKSIYEKFFTLAFEVICYPGHQKGENPKDSFELGEERRTGCLIQKTEDEFVEHMRNRFN